MTEIIRSLQTLRQDEEGAQVIEYALIIAVVSIALTLALSAITGANMAGFIARVGTCLTGVCV
jgi:pilus assembly protein Flp/PilA